MGARPLERRADPAGHRDMVVLDQHRVVEAEAVIGAAAQPHRLLFEDAQAGGGLAGADDLRLVPGDRIDQRAGRGGDPRQAADQVQRGALGRRARRARCPRCGQPADRARPGRRRGRAARCAGPGRAARRRAAPASRPASTPGWRAAITASMRASAGTTASLVMSPARPRSSSSAARTIGSIRMRSIRIHRFKLPP